MQRAAPGARGGCSPRRAEPGRAGASGVAVPAPPPAPCSGAQDPSQIADDVPHFAFAATISSTPGL